MGVGDLTLIPAGKRGRAGGIGEQSYLFPSPARRSRVLLAWMCQRDSDVATCRTMTLMESRWMEKSWW